MVVQAEEFDMSSKAVKFYSRAPRYSLRPTDNHYMRFAHRNDSHHTYTTRFIDISQSGLAFVCDYEMAPRISELIKVEIPLNDGDKNHTVAWWARVVRIGEYDGSKWYMKKADFENSHQVLVAITFHELPPSHSKAIRQTLEKKFAEVYLEERKRHWSQALAVLTGNFLRFSFYAACIALAIWILYVLSRPSPTYDPQKGSPWGERFPNMPLKPGKPQR